MRLPKVPLRCGLGLGLDLPHGAPIGFEHHPSRGDFIAPRVARFLERTRGRFASLFVSWQPRDRARLDPARYFDAYDHLFAQCPFFDVRALHHTALNLGALEAYDRSALCDFTNALIERYDLKWVNEDLGVWSIHGRPLAYPLPPYLTDAGLRAAIRNTREAQARLAAPLQVEFPGFSEGTSFVLGRAHAYDFFRRVAEESDVCVALDTGHLLSYQWLRGARGEDLFGELERLPLSHCTEIHLSGCEVTDQRFYDHHHGVLMREQITLLERLIPLCPALRVVTYEDPKFDEGAELPEPQRASLDALSSVVARWTT